MLLISVLTLPVNGNYTETKNCSNFLRAGPHSETGSNCFYSVPGTESDTETEWFRILRVPYAQTTDSK